jgi:hypothetical protein
MKTFHLRLIAQLSLCLAACGGAGTITELEDLGTSGDVADDDTTVEAAVTSIPVAISTAAKKNLARVVKDIDSVHLFTYHYSGTSDVKFVKALSKEFGTQHPDMYKRKMQVLASVAFVQAPEILPPAEGRLTPFHGLDSAAYDRLKSIEDQVFSQLVSQNGSARGVPPFSVCETRFMVEKWVKNPAAPAFSWAKYRADYAAYAATCPQADRDEWYNFRGLGQLRPTWLESNVMDRFTRRMNDLCRTTATTTTLPPECTTWKANRLAYRDGKNAELGRRMFVYHPSQESWLGDPNQPLVIVPDRDGDGVGEMITPANTFTDSKGTHPVTITASTQFTGRLNASPSKIAATQGVDPSFDPAQDLGRVDFGLLRMFPNAGGCDSLDPSPAACPVLKRFFVMIDRHENFYQTYTSLNPTSTSIGQQPSPLVACSITLAASDWWAHNSPSGVDGFVFVMRVPFANVLSGTGVRAATGPQLPRMTAVRELYQAGASLDFTQVWVDVATLSHNQYASEHEISKYGWVRPEQIEGVIYTGAPAVVP